ncbi:MAG: methyltransferase domain-containing protein, partial [Candidatus Omnitrophica bacterium]|nr:methyltransferase domain-containing protein [Candidatus Omnitrophota bacterium]
MHKGRSVVECGEYKVIDCSECGFKHLDPIPSEEELGRYYKERYFQEEIPKLLSPEKEARESEWSELWHRDRLLTFNRYALGETRSLLDVGCGNGFFADFMRRNYWEVTCVEPSEKAYLHAKELGLNVFKGTFENFVEEKRTGSFDAINLKSVLEHMPDPAGTLENCKSLLKREGIMCVYVPNDFNSFQL